MDDLERADGSEQERARQALAEQLDAGVAMLDVTQHARHDPPALERLPVGRHRALVAGARSDVGERVRSHAALGGGFEPVRVERDRRADPADALAVDLGLAVSAVHGRASQHTSTTGVSPVSARCLKARGGRLADNSLSYEKSVKRPRPSEGPRSFMA